MPPSALPHPPSPSGGHTLRRSRDGKKIAGVCAGFGRYTGTDPVLFRVALVVLAFFGGVGCIIYLAGWLFLREDGDTASPVEAVLGRGSSRTSTVTTIVLAIVGAIGVATGLNGRDAVLLIAAAAGCAYLARHPRTGQIGGAAAGTPTPWAPAPATSTGLPAAPTAMSPTAMTPTPMSPTAMAPTGVAGDDATLTTMPAAYAPHGPYVDPYGAFSTAPEPAPVAVPRQKSILGRVGASLALLAVGIVAAVDALRGGDLPVSAYPAAALAVVAGALLVGAWSGRSRLLILLGLVLTVVLAAATSITHLTDHSRSVGSRLWTAATARDVRASYDLGMGAATLALRTVDFRDLRTQIRAHVGVGRLVVLVPADVDVTVNARTGAGDLRLFGQESNGTGVQRTTHDDGADGPGGGTLQLDLNQGIGYVEVTRD